MKRGTEKKHTPSTAHPVPPSTGREPATFSYGQSGYGLLSYGLRSHGRNSYGQKKVMVRRETATAYSRRQTGFNASPTACLLRGYGHAGTQNDRLAEAVILSTGTPIPTQWTCRRRRRDRAARTQVRAPQRIAAPV